MFILGMALCSSRKQELGRQRRHLGVDSTPSNVVCPSRAHIRVRTEIQRVRWGPAPTSCRFSESLGGLITGRKITTGLVGRRSDRRTHAGG